MPVTIIPPALKTPQKNKKTKITNRLSHPRFSSPKSPQSAIHKTEMTDDDFPKAQSHEPAEGLYELTIWDKTNPRSLINIVWVDMVPVIERAKEECWELMQRSERKLRIRIKPPALLDMLRLRFWQDYDRAQQVGNKMILKGIIDGLCSKDYFWESVCKNPKYLAWVLLPMAGYITRMESSLYRALDEIEDIIRIPIKRTVTDKHGNETVTYDTKLIEQKIKIFQMLDLRVKGAVVQKLAIHSRIDQRTQISSGDPFSKMNIEDLTALDKSIQQVRRQIESAQSREFILPEKAESEVIEVGGTTVDDSGSD